VGAGKIGDDVHWRQGVDADAAVAADPDGGQVGDRLTGFEIDVRGRRPFGVARLGSEVSGPFGLRGGQVEGDRRSAAGDGWSEIDGEDLTGGELACGRADSHPGVDDPLWCDRDEARRRRLGEKTVGGRWPAVCESQK
jgi:hypothetical protein